MEGTISIGGMTIAYREMGQGALIVILHGWGSSYRSWVNVQDRIAVKGFRVIVPDLPGFGKTPAPVGAWSVSDYCAFTKEFVRALLPNQEEKFFLLGHSFGGRIAISYAAAYGNELDGLILCDAAGILRHKRKKVALFFSLTKIGNMIFGTPFLRVVRSRARDEWYRLIREKDYYRTSGTMRATFRNVVEENLAGKLPSIKIPTLILWGEHDKATPLEDARIIHRGIAESRLEILKSAGHAINLECSVELARLVVDFMKEHS